MRVVYIGPETGVQIPNVADFPRGVPVDVDDRLGCSLLEQGTFTPHIGAPTEDADVGEIDAD